MGISLRLLDKAGYILKMNRFFISFCVIWAVNASVLESKQDLTNQWKAGPGDIYYVISPLPMNWYEAGEWCVANKGIMAEPRNEEQTAAINQLLQPDANYWIGANDLAVEGSFKWVSDGQVVTNGYTNWAPNEPNNRYDSDCAHLYYYQNHMWDDYMCEASESGEGQP